MAGAATRRFRCGARSADRGPPGAEEILQQGTALRAEDAGMDRNPMVQSRRARELAHRAGRTALGIGAPGDQPAHPRGPPFISPPFASSAFAALAASSWHFFTSFSSIPIVSATSFTERPVARYLLTCLQLTAARPEPAIPRSKPAPITAIPSFMREPPCADARSS